MSSFQNRQAVFDPKVSFSEAHHRKDALSAMSAVYCSFYYTYKRMRGAQSADRLNRRSIHREVQGLQNRS